MSAVLSNDVINDEIAITVAEVLATANLKAKSLGFDLLDSLISVSQFWSEGEQFWRIHYGPKNPVGRRGGDLTIDVDPTNGEIVGVKRGQ